MDDTLSPWWYRTRDRVLFATYIVGFFGGDMLWRMTGAPYEDTAQWLAGFLGARWLEPIFVLAALAMVACFAMRLWGASYLSASVVWTPNAQTGALFVAGPFRFLRNPLYFGSLLMAVSFSLLASPLGCAIILAGNAIVMHMLMGYEAERMHERYGDVYDRYVHAVPALLPRLTPFSIEGSTTARPSLAQGVNAEIFSGTCAVAMILLVAMRGGLPIWVFLGLIVGGWLAQRLVASR